MPDRQQTELAKKLIGIIRAEGPITVERYMAHCLGDSDGGYYKKRDPLGAAGDFITAPEISQIFGELIGLWSAEMWRIMGQAGPIKLIELGPGRGVLMSDAMRACKAAPQFHDNVEIHLVEINEVLKEKQSQSLAGYEGRVFWHDSVEQIPDGPAIIIANEFFDALPVRQFQWDGGNWQERCVALGESESGFTFEAGPHIANDSVKQHLLTLIPNPEQGDIFEYREPCLEILKSLAQRLHKFPTALLIIDYGHEESGTGDTLQAVRGHRFCAPLEFSGEADLTTQVDFNQFKVFAEKSGLPCFGPMTQGQFLLMLGLEARLNQLMKAARSTEEAELLRSGAVRLAAPNQMGALFKAFCMVSPGQQKPPPF